MSSLPIIDTSDRPEADAEQRMQLARIRGAVEFASVVCAGDRGDMLVTFIGAIAMIARSVVDPDGTLAEVQAAFGDVRKRLAEHRAAAAPATREVAP